MSVESAVTEPCEDQHCSSRLNVCPRVVSLNKPGKSARVPVRIFNLSAKAISIPAKSNLRDLQEVNVLRRALLFQENKTGQTARVKQQNINKSTEENPSETNFKISLDNTNLSEEQKQEVQNFLSKWDHIFSKGSTDIGQTDVLEHEIHLTDNTPFK